MWHWNHKHSAGRWSISLQFVSLSDVEQIALQLCLVGMQHLLATDIVSFITKLPY